MWEGSLADGGAPKAPKGNWSPRYASDGHGDYERADSMAIMLEEGMRGAMNAAGQRWAGRVIFGSELTGCTDRISKRLVIGAVAPWSGMQSYHLPRLLSSKVES